MSNKLLLYVAIFLTVLSAVTAISGFNVLEDTLNIDLAPDREKIVPLTIINTGTDTVTLVFDTSQLDLTDRNDNEITLRFEPSQPVLQPNENSTVDMILKPDRGISFESFGGPLRVYDLNNSAVQDIVNLNLEVQPDVCDFGVIGSDLEIDIQEPGNGDDFKPGEEIDIEVKVSNNGQNSIRVQSEAFLFSKSRNIQDTASETKTIEEDDDFTFKMTMIMPSNPDGINKDEDLRLVVKAFDDENERRNCIIDTVPINLKLEDRAVSIDVKESRVLPEIAACGDTVKGYVRVQNIGAKDNDRVTVSLVNRELGVNLKSDTFSLDKFDDGDRSLATRQFDIKIPETAKEKNYPFTARVEFNGGSEEKTLPFQVISCQGAKRDQDGINTVFIRPLESQITLSQGASIAVPVQITNLLNSRVIYTVAVTNIGEIGQAGTKTITINPGQITTAFIDLSIKADAEPGLYSGSILVKQGLQTVGAETLLIEVKEGQAQTASGAPAIESIPLTVWIILVILATGAVILAIMASFQYFKRQQVVKP